MSLYEKHITPLVTSAFLWGLRTYNVIKDTWLELLEQNPPLQWAVSEAQYTAQVIYSFMTAMRMEPREMPWMATYGLVPKEVGITNRFSLIENVNPFFSSYFFDDLFGGKAELEYILKYISAMGSRIGSELLSPLVVIKGIHDSQAIYLVRKGPFSKINEQWVMEPSSWKKVAPPFLSVEYTHHEMGEAVELKMDAGWWREGNELFTPAFVLRALEYQSVGYYFDEDYKIRVMDMNCNIIELTSNMYIVVKENGYEWRREEVFPPAETDGYLAESDSSGYLCLEKEE
jgi:hypothetical protein